LLTSSATCSAVAGVERGRTRALEQDLAAGIAGHGHREPAHEPEVGVGLDLQAELVDVELQCLVLVEHEDLREIDS
jgi:hypothetical protein